MSIPSQEEFQQPLLDFLRAQPGPVSNELVHRALADYFRLTPEERDQREGFNRPVYKNRIAWAYVNLQKQGLCVPMTENKEYQLSAEGRRILRSVRSAK